MLPEPRSLKKWMSVLPVQSRAMALDLVTLSSNRFHQATLSAFTSLLEDVHFNDVTLACKDGQQVKAHKVILASASPFFKTILIQNHHQHPLIYLKGVDARDLRGILKFIYSGEVEVEKEEVARFMGTANDLEIDGLTLGQETKGTEKTLEVDGFTTSKAPNSPKENTSVKEEVDEVDEGEYMMVSPVQEMSEEPNGVEAVKSQHACPGCNFSSNFRNNVLRHVKLKHQGEYLDFSKARGKPAPTEKYQHACTVCDYSTRFKNNLVRHINNRHSEIKNITF